MDIDRIIDAFSTLYSQSGSLDDVNGAQRFIDEIVNDSSVVIDLKGGLEKGNDDAVFGLCNIIYQQTQLFRRTPNIGALSSYSNTLSCYILSLLHSQRPFPSEIALNRICLCYAVLQTFDDNSLKKLIVDCFELMMQGPEQLRVYLTVYRSILEEVDSNHLPEYIKDQIIEVLIESKSQWMGIIYALLQKQLPVSAYCDLISCLSYSIACCSLPDLYSYPNETQQDSNFLALLLHLSTVHLQTPLFHQIIRLLISLMETIGYPVHRLIKPSMELIYPSLMVFCGYMIQGQVDEDIMNDIVQLLLSMVIQYPKVLEIRGGMNMDVLRVLLFVTELKDLEFASLPMDVWLFITEKPAFYVARTPEGVNCSILLLNTLRNQLVIQEADQISSHLLYSRFSQLDNQFKLIRNLDTLLNWKPLYAEDSRAEIYPAILELETSPFRHGPPGCEDVIRCLYSQMTTQLLNHIVNEIERETEEMIIEADLYVVGQFIEEINSDKEAYPVTEEITTLLSHLVSVLLQSVPFDGNHLLLVRQTLFLFTRLLQMQTVWSSEVLLQITTLALGLLKSNECSSYAADLLLFLVTLYTETILSDSLCDSLIQVYSNSSLVPYTQVKLAKVITTLYKNTTIDTQLNLLSSLLSTTFQNVGDSIPQICLSLYKATTIINTSCQLYHLCHSLVDNSYIVDFTEAAREQLSHAIEGVMSVCSAITADATSPGGGSEESETMICFCVFLQNSLRGCYLPCFSTYISTIMNVLIGYFQKYYQSSFLLKTITLLTKVYAREFPADFYNVLKNIAKIALSNSQYNNDEYLKELFVLLTTLPSICSSHFGYDQECISDVLQICEVYLRTGSMSGKSSCFRFLNRVLQMENDSEQVFAVISQVAPQLLQLVICECINWERPLLRLGSNFVFYLVMAIIPQSEERSKTIIDMIATQYPESFSQEELQKIDGLFSIRLTRYLDLSQFVMVFTDVVGVINNTNTKDSLLAYEMVYSVLNKHI